MSEADANIEGFSPDDGHFALRLRETILQLKAVGQPPTPCDADLSATRRNIADAADQAFSPGEINLGGPIHGLSGCLRSID